jgi:ATP-dependent Clp protease, protease subunit
MSNLIVAQLLFLESENPGQGHPPLHQLARWLRDGRIGHLRHHAFVRPDVSTMCIGQAASMGALLLAGGAKGKRFCLPHSRMMIHQPLGGFHGQATDIDIHAREILYIRDRLNQILSHHTGQPIEKIADDTERDRFMSGDEACTYGLIDKVITERGPAATKG